MKIAVIANPFGEKHPSGLGTSTYETTKNLIERNSDVQFDVFVKGKKEKKQYFKGTNWQLIELPDVPFWLDRYLPRESDHDLFVFVSTPVMPLTFIPKNAVVVARDFAHFTLPPDNFKQRLERIVINFVHRSSIRRAKHVVAISEGTKNEAISIFGLSPEKITVIYNGLAKLTDLKEEPLPNVREPFFFYMGVLKWRKNIHACLEAFAQFKKHDTRNYSFIVAGSKGGDYFEKLEKIVRDNGLVDHVQFPGYITDEQGAFLYRHATAFIFPSLLEGFGKPVIEAMSFGTPVLTSDEPPLNEIAGWSAHLVNPHEVDSIATGMEQLATDDAYCLELRTRGIEHAKQFTWEKTADNFMSLFREVVG